MTKYLNRPRLLDLFCGAGGASMGYHMAGFDVVGIDIKPQPRYPFPFIQADALKPPVDLKAFDVIHASPPCQAYSCVTLPKFKVKHEDLVDVVREMLSESGKPFVIENVPGSPLVNPMILCGSMFGLRASSGELRRHRLFESNKAFALLPDCQHRARAITVATKGGGYSRKRGRPRFPSDVRAQAMGIDWMRPDEVGLAIPPAYTEFIGRQLLS